jgi:type I restriction enzyme S subunit
VSGVALVALGDIATLQAGVGFPLDLQGRSSGRYPLAKVGDISRVGRSGEVVIRAADHFVSESDLDRLRAKPIPAGSVLFAKIGEAIRQNHRVIAGCALLIDNNAMAAIPTNRVESRYLFHFLRTVDFYALASATTVPALRKSELERVPVPLPTRPEQRRIAQILDIADALRTKRRDALAELDALTRSIFFYMFGDPVTNPKGWAIGTIGEVADQVTDGEHLTPRRATQGIKLLSARNIRDGYLDFANVDYIDPDEYERISRRCDPSVGDVLISCSGSIGRVASVETTEKFSLVRSAALIRPNRGKIVSKFLEHYLRTPAMKARMLRRANASSQANLFQGQIRELPVYLPPIRLQSEFVDRCATIARVRDCERASRAEFDALMKSIQHRAFRGEL